MYQLSPLAGGDWKETILHSFDANGKDGVEPDWGALFMDRRGSLYGTTSGGGLNFCGSAHTLIGGERRRPPAEDIGNCGTIFKLTKAANGVWKEAILYNFKRGPSGYFPAAGVVIGKAGVLYGTAIDGGYGGCGVVYKLAPDKGGKWKYTVLHTFTGEDGCQPDANLILDSKGNLYGTTATGGGASGVVFELTP